MGSCLDATGFKSGEVGCEEGAGDTETMAGEDERAAETSDERDVGGEDEVSCGGARGAEGLEGEGVGAGRARACAANQASMPALYPRPVPSSGIGWPLGR
jgi:hypothetical protein